MSRRARQAARSLLAAAEAAEYWLAEELERPGETTPGEILRDLRAAIARAKKAA